MDAPHANGVAAFVFMRGNLLRWRLNARSDYLPEVGIDPIGENLGAERRTAEPRSFEQDFEVGEVLDVEGLSELAELFFGGEELGGRAGRIGIRPRDDNYVAAMARVRQIGYNAVADESVWILRGRGV